jgi:hypothetical protein
LASAGEEETRENVDPPVDRSFHRSAFSRPSMKGDAKGVDDASRSRSGRFRLGATIRSFLFSPPRLDWLPAQNPREVSE